jgi:CrcB protein
MMPANPTRTTRRRFRLPRRLAAPAAVLAGGLIGSAARSGVGSAFPVGAGRFPVTTFLINVSGSLLLGFFLARRQRAVTRGWSLHLWGIGALGSFTTFSTFSVEAFRLIDAGAWALVGSYAVASTILGLSAALLGQRIGRVGR